MRLGGPVFGTFTEPEPWIAALKAEGYRAAVCPAIEIADAPRWVRAATESDIVIAEVGAWSNPISRDDDTRRKAIAHCQSRLALADAVGARCCVNIAGSRGAQWDGPDPENFSEETFALIVDTVREIIDAVRPTQTFYALEMMPWVFPDGPESYLRLIHAIDRPGFGVHLDPVNIVSSPRRFYDNAALIRECFQLLGPWIKNCHAKDIALRSHLTVHLDEVIPGQGGLDYAVYLSELSRLDSNISLILEHLPDAASYREAAGFVRMQASKLGISL